MPLGIQPVLLADITYLFSLKGLGYEQAQQFVAKIKEAEAAKSADAMEQSASQLGGDASADHTLSQGKATDKCRVKMSSQKSGNPSATVSPATESNTVVSMLVMTMMMRH